MRKTVLFVAVLALALSAVPTGLTVAGPTDPAFRGRPFPSCPENTGRIVTFSCVPGAAAGVGGIYGGTTFGLICNGFDGRHSSTTTTICTKAGDHNWALSGAASLRNGAQVRFAPSGSSRTVHYMVGNGDVRLTIR